LKEEGDNNTTGSIDNKTLLEEYLLPGLKGSKDILGSLYAFKSRARGGFVGKVKTTLQKIIINTVINVIEKQSMKQQKFNELTYKAIEGLIKENTDLRSKLDQ